MSTFTYHICDGCGLSFKEAKLIKAKIEFRVSRSAAGRSGIVKFLDLCEACTKKTRTKLEVVLKTLKGSEAWKHTNELPGDVPAKTK